MKPELFVKMNLPHAKLVEAKTGILALATLTHSANEMKRFQGF